MLQSCDRQQGQLCNLPMTVAILCADSNLNTRSTVFHTFKGHFGNQLFQYAAIVGIAKWSGALACFDQNPLSPMFEDTKTMYVRPAPWNVARRSESNGYATYVHFQVKGDTQIAGFLQSHPCFSPKVLQEVKITQRFRSEARIFLTRMLNITTRRPRVAIHIREEHGANEGVSWRWLVDGDSENDAYLRLPTKSFFEHAMKKVRELHPGTIFVVLLDNPQWCTQQSYLQHANVHIVTQPNAPILDIALIAECEHVILTRGSFGWWGAFLGAVACGGLVLYNAAEFDMQHPANAGRVVVSDYYPAHWVAIPVTSKLSTAAAWYELP